MSDEPTPQTDASVIYVCANSVEQLRGSDCISLSATVFRNGGSVSGREAIPFVRAERVAELERENARLKATLEDLYAGRSVVLPKSDKHARDMMLVAGACASTTTPQRAASPG